MNDRFLCVSEGAYGFFRAGFSLNTGNIEGHKNIRLGLAHKMLLNNDKLVQEHIQANKASRRAPFYIITETQKRG